MKNREASSFIAGYERPAPAPANKTTPPATATTTQQVNEGPFLYGLPQLAFFLQVSETTAARIRKANFFPSYKRGRAFMFVKSEVLEGLKIK